MESQHDVEHGAFDYAAESARTGVALDCLLGDRLQGGVLKLELDIFIREQLGVLLGERVLRLHQDFDQRGLVERVQYGNSTASGR